MQYESISEYNLYLCRRIVPEQVLSCCKKAHNYQVISQ